MAVLVIAVVVALFAGWAAAVVCLKAQSMAERLKEAEKRIKVLEDAQAKRAPYFVIEEIENAMAAINGLEFEMQLKENLLENARAHLNYARDGKKKQ